MLKKDVQTGDMRGGIAHLSLRLLRRQPCNKACTVVEGLGESTQHRRERASTFLSAATTASSVGNWLCTFTRDSFCSRKD